MIYLTLFGISFLSSTLLPLGSEAFFLYALSQEEAYFLLWLSATLGNTLGAVVNYALGIKGENFLLKKGYVSLKRISQTKRYFSKYGGWTLLFSWLPLIGDPLTFIAGILRYEFKYFVAIVLIAKGLRYALVIFLSSSLSV